MSALATLVVVWLGAEPPADPTRATLDRWAALHHVSLAEPNAEPAENPEAKSKLASMCDRELEAARDQINAGDDDAAGQTLARLEQTLRSHPELVQAAWLLAERYRLQGQIAARAGEPVLPWQERADVLEGRRASSFGEDPRGAVTLAPVDVVLAVHGARRHEAYWDGANTSDRFSTAKGEHHLALVRASRVVWSGWVSVLISTTLDVWISDAAPCSVDDLAGVTIGDGTTVTAPKGTGCPSWVVAGPGPGASVRTALCRLDQCEALSTSGADVLAPEPPRTADAKKGLPGWFTWTAAGIGAAAATSLILWQAGAFDHASPTAKVIYDGSKL